MDTFEEQCYTVYITYDEAYFIFSERQETY